MNQMVLCARCKRHVFAGEPSCPFCALVFSADAKVGDAPSSWAPGLSRVERYALGTAIALTLAGAGCAKDDGPRVEPESVNAPAVSAAPNDSPKAEKPTPERSPAPTDTPNGTANGAPPSPFLVGSPAATPAPLETAVATVQTTPPKKPPPPPPLTNRPPPPPPPPDDPFEEGGGWRGRRGHSCVRNGNGQMVCPPYGCVFPDEACDIERV